VGQPRFRRRSHTADVRLAVWGETAEVLLRHTVLGVASLALGRPSRRRPERWRPVEDWPADLGEQLVRAANEALFYIYLRHEAGVDFRLREGVGSLATVKLRHDWPPKIEVKAATYHDLTVVREGTRLHAVLTLDL
jgi:SHS2 domain-containing protein